ncbi:MAG: 30S ribosomal protein S21 [Clostridia bacterium]
MLKRFKRKMSRSEIFAEVRKREHYEKTDCFFQMSPKDFSFKFISA